MNKYYCDGSTYKNGQEGQDSSMCVVTPNGTVIREHLGDFSINYAELSAIERACEICELGDTIYSDSMIAVNWVNNFKQTKKNLYLSEKIKRTNDLFHEKGLFVKYVPRDENLAGLEIEERPFYKSIRIIK